LKLAEDELAIKTTENEELKRKIIVAEQKVAMAKESEEDYRKKLDDKLFLGGRFFSQVSNHLHLFSLESEVFILHSE
jgi:hypothetical protein